MSKDSSNSLLLSHSIGEAFEQGVGGVSRRRGAVRKGKGGHLGLAKNDPLGLFPALVQQVSMPLGMGAHHSDQLLHLAKHSLALFRASRAARLLRHLDAQPVHPAQELFRGFHATTQPSLAD